jgi:hypothetical protein
VKQRTQGSWFDPDDVFEKAEAIKEIVDVLYSPEGGTCCEGNCTSEGDDCIPLSIKFKCNEGEADLGLAECKMFGKKQQAYIYECRKKGKITIETKCECKKRPPM